MLADESQFVRLAAAETIDETGWNPKSVNEFAEAYVELLMAAEESAFDAYRRRSTFKPDLTGLTEILSGSAKISSERTVLLARNIALGLLTYLNRQSGPGLSFYDKAWSAAWEAVYQAVRFLARTGGAEASRACITLLAGLDSHERVLRKELIEALGRIGGDEAIDTVLNEIERCSDFSDAEAIRIVDQAMRIVKVTGTSEQIERLGTMRDKILAKRAAWEAAERAKREASEGAERARRIAPAFFCFVCCGNPSVASSFYAELTSRVPTLISALGMRLDSVARYIADDQAIRGMRSDIAARDLSYKGFQLMGNQEESIEKLDDWLIWIRDEVHIVYACAQVDMYPRLQRVYNEIFSQALSQRILPFPMLVTQSAETKQFLLKACTAFR